MAAPISRFRLTAAQLPFEQNDYRPDQSADAGIQVARQAERSNHVAGN